MPNVTLNSNRASSIRSNEILLAVNGKILDGFVEGSFERSIENFCGQFSFSTTIKETTDREIQNQIKLQDKIEVFIDEEFVMTGVVENLNVSYDATSHNIQISGRDVTGNLVDSSIRQKQYKERNLSKLIRMVLDDNGWSDIGVVDLLPTPALIPSFETIKTESSDSIFTFIDRYAERNQVFINTDADGNLTLSTEGSEGFAGALISVKDGKNNNILSANLTLSSTDRFKFIEVFSQSSSRTFSGKKSITQKGVSTDNEVLYPRRKIITAGKATQKSVLDKLAQWNVTVRKAKGIRYDCKTVGFYAGLVEDNAVLWEINTLAEILDDKCDMNGIYLIQGVKFTKTLNGSFTNLSIVQLGSFTIDPDKKYKNSVGNAKKKHLVSFMASS